MKKIINAIKDFLYNITDYGLIIAVIAIMIAVLAWRFDILFNRGIEKEMIATEPNTSQNSGTNVNDNTDDENSGNIDNEDNDSSEGDNSIISVEIPQGSFPNVIAEILFTVDLIEDENEFLNRSVELGLDTKLQSGTYEIETGTSLDDIIKIIAHRN